MLTFDLARALPETNRLSAGDVGHLIAGVVAEIGEPCFGDSVVASLREVADIDFWSVYRVVRGMRPIMYSSGSHGRRDISGDCFERYRSGLYEQDQTFDPATELARKCGAALSLINEGEVPSPHREEIYRRHGIGERLSIVVPEGDQGLLAVNLYKYRRCGAFRSEDIEAIRCVGEGLLACVRKHVALQDRMLRPALPGASVTALQPDHAERLRQRCPQITRREMDVCLRLLKGWTYDGIAADLGLSITSVKTYRNRAFDRLGIHYRNELFALIT